MSAEIKNTLLLPNQVYYPGEVVKFINDNIHEIPDDIKNSGRFQFLKTTNPCVVLILTSKSIMGTVYNFKDKESADKFYDFVNNPRVRYTYYSRVGCGGGCPWEFFEEVAETYSGTCRDLI
jgi:hypothetical protein